MDRQSVVYALSIDHVVLGDSVEMAQEHCFLLHCVTRPTIVVFHVCPCLLTANYKGSLQS